MSTDPVTNGAHHRKYLIALGLLVSLAGIGATIRAPATNAAAETHRPATPESNTMMTCTDPDDVFELDVPGTYSAFAVTSTGALPTHVRGSHGEVLATTHATHDNTIPVDGAAGARFGIGPPQVFQLTSNVMIHVESQNAPYELVIVRLGKYNNEGGIDIRPPVERVLNESGSCLLGDLREFSRVHIDAIYSDPDARQVYVVESAAEEAEIDAYKEIDAHAEG